MACDSCVYKGCPRVDLRMECPECGYPFCEAMYMLDPRIPHLDTEEVDECRQKNAAIE